VPFVQQRETTRESKIYVRHNEVVRAKTFQEEEDESDRLLHSLYLSLSHSLYLSLLDGLDYRLLSIYPVYIVTEINAI